MRLKAGSFPAASTALAVVALALAASPCRAAASAAPDPANSPPSAAASGGGASPAALPLAGGRNLLANGDFARGSGKSPDHWRTGGWNESPSVTQYDWLHQSGGAPELTVTSLQPNDARWLQSLSLGPGYYYLGVEVRTEDVPPNAAGAYVSLDEDSVNSPDLRGTSDWRRVGLYLKIGAHGADVDIALRLGGFGSLNTGRAFFRDARLVRLEALPAAAAPVFDLAAVRRASVAPPVGKPWTLWAMFLFLGGVAAAGWYVYGAAGVMFAAAPSDPPASAPPPRVRPRGLARGGRRRRSRRRR